MKIEDIKKMAQAWNSVQEASYGKPKKEAMDPVDAKELKGKHKDRKDKDINNDGKVDSTDKYLHKRRKAVSTAIKGGKKDQEVEVQTQEGKLPPALQAYMDKKKGKKSDDKKDDLDEAKQKNWIVTVVKPVNKLKKGMKVIVPARNTAEAIKKALKKMGENIDAAIGSRHLDVKLDEANNGVAEAKDHGNTDNGSKAGEGLSPSAKKELARTTPMPDAVNEPVVDKKTFDAIRASGKKAPMRSNDNAQGDKTPPKAGK